MKILVKRTIHYYVHKYPQAEKALQLWVSEFSSADYANFNQIKRKYINASIIANRRVIFNIKGNDYRLIVSINFLQKACYVIWFGTHEEYNKIDAATIAYDIKINNFKLK